MGAISVDSDEVTISGFRFDDELRAAWNFGSWSNNTSGPYNMVGLYSKGDNITIHNNVFSGFSLAQLVASNGHYNIEGNYFKDSCWDTHYPTLKISSGSADIKNNKWSKSIGMLIQESIAGGEIKGNIIDTIWRGIQFTANSNVENWEIEDNTFSASSIPDNYGNPLTNWIGFESKGALDLEELMENNIFDKGSQIIGNKIIIPEEGKVYNQGSGKEYNTIQAAINDATENDTILIGSGEYDEILEINNKSLTIVGYDVENTRVKAIGARPGNLVVSNLTVYGNSHSGYSFAAIFISTGNVTIDNCKIASDGTNEYRSIETQYNNDANIIITNCDISGYNLPYFNPSTGNLKLEGNNFNNIGPSIDSTENVQVNDNINMSVGLFIGYGLLDKEFEDILSGLDNELKEFVKGLHLNNTDSEVRLSTNNADNTVWGGFYTGLDGNNELIITGKYPNE